MKRKIIFNKAGGNASKGANSCKISLPASAIKALAVNENNRNVTLEIKGDSVIIRREKVMEKFNNNNIEVELGESICMAEYDTLVDENVGLAFEQNLIEEKEDCFLFSVATNGDPGDMLVVDVVAKLKKQRNFETLEDLELFFREDSSFWDLKVEIIELTKL